MGNLKQNELVIVFINPFTKEFEIKNYTNLNSSSDLSGEIKSDANGNYVIHLSGTITLYKK